MGQADMADSAGGGARSPCPIRHGDALVPPACRLRLRVHIPGAATTACGANVLKSSAGPSDAVPPGQAQLASPCHELAEIPRARAGTPLAQRSARSAAQPSSTAGVTMHGRHHIFIALL